MGATNPPWKVAERRAARLFGAERRVTNAASAREEHETDDASHPRLYIESKCRGKCATRTLWRDTKAKAKKHLRIYQGGHKVPVLVLREKGKPGALLVVHQDDYPEVTVEWLAARDPDQLAAILEAVRLRRRDGDEGRGAS